MRVFVRLRMRSIRVLLFGLMQRCDDVVDVCGWKIDGCSMDCVVRKKKKLCLGGNRREEREERGGGRG